MANLKGGTFEKQIKDAFHRLEAFGVGRVGKNDHLTHSDKLAEKRMMYLKDIANYFTSQNLEGKLNTLMTKDNLDKFFNDRLENLSIKTQECYYRGISSMLNGMSEQNIYIPLHYEDKDFFDFQFLPIIFQFLPKKNKMFGTNLQFLNLFLDFQRI